jgi:hypothetical protein
MLVAEFTQSEETISLNMGGGVVTMNLQIQMKTDITSQIL